MNKFFELTKKTISINKWIALTGSIVFTTIGVLAIFQARDILDYAKWPVDVFGMFFIILGLWLGLGFVLNMRK